MRSYPLYQILLLCLLILIIDIMAYYWLQSITQYITSNSLKTAINILFWFFTIGLITSIIILKIRLDNIHPARKQMLISSLYGLTILSFIPKLIFIIVISILHFTNFVFLKEQSLLVFFIIGIFLMPVCLGCADTRTTCKAKKTVGRRKTLRFFYF